MCLVNAWSTCHKNSTKNRELILTYLIPCRLITKSQIPSAQVLQEFPHLRALFGDLVRSIKQGDLAGFDKAFAEGEPEFVRRRVFLTLERSRDIALRNLLRKVFLAGGYEDLKEGQSEKDRIRKTRIPLSHFVAALRMGSGGGQIVDDEEVECLLANMIYKVRIRNTPFAYHEHYVAQNLHLTLAQTLSSVESSAWIPLISQTSISTLLTIHRVS